MRSGSVRCSKDHHNKVITLSFREVARAPNWLNSWRNTVAEFGLDAEHRAHGGFVHEYLGLRLGVEELMEASCNNDDADWLLIMTGWSLGGALAILCAVDMFDPAMWRDRWCHKSLVTFGAPRTVNYELAKWLNAAPLEHHLRVQAEGDPANSYPNQVHGHYWHSGRLALLRFHEGEWQIAEHAQEAGEEVSLLRRTVETATTPLRLFDFIHPSIAAFSGVLIGFFLDLPFNLPNLRIHFTSFKEAYAESNGLLPPCPAFSARSCDGPTLSASATLEPNDAVSESEFFSF